MKKVWYYLILIKRFNATLKASTFAIRTSQRTDQKFQTSLLCQRKQKLFYKNFPTLQKNKNTPTHSQTNAADNDTKIQY